jgi:hypothetical protein
MKHKYRLSSVFSLLPKDELSILVDAYKNGGITRTELQREGAAVLGRELSQDIQNLLGSAGHRKFKTYI